MPKAQMLDPETGEWETLCRNQTRYHTDGLCKSLKKSHPNYQYRMTEDGQPNVYYAIIEEREKTKIIW